MTHASMGERTIVCCGCARARSTPACNSATRAREVSMGELMDQLTSLGIGAFDEAKDRSLFLVHPILVILNAIFFLDSFVSRMGGPHVV